MLRNYVAFTTYWNRLVWQSNYALKAINGAGNDLTRLENKRKPGNADLTRLEKSDLSRDFFSCLDCDSDRKDFLEFFWIFAKDLLRKWGANIPSRVKLDGESIGSISRGRGDLQQCRMMPFVSKNVLKRKSVTLKKYGGKLENGGPIFFWGMCGVIFCWTAGEGPGWFAWLLRPLERRLVWERPH